MAWSPRLSRFPTAALLLLGATIEEIMAASPEKEFSVVAHGFSAGDPLTFNTGSWGLADNSSSSTLALAIVSEVASVDAFTAYALGGDFLTLASHALGSAGDPLYLGSGVLTTAKPSGVTLLQPIAVVIDANTLLVQSYEAGPAEIFE